MATPGVPFDVSLDEIVISIKKHKGRLTKVAKEFGCCYQTIRNHTDNYKEVVDLIKSLREDREENLLDDAEDTLSDAMQGRFDDMGNALKSAFFILNNKGKTRGYTPPNSMQELVINRFTPEQITQSITLDEKIDG